MKSHNAQRGYHFSGSAQALVDQMADDFIQINRGIIDSLDREGAVAGFQKYFERVNFIKWDDLRPPVIRFSDDRTLAYMIVDKIVVLTTPGANGEQIEETTHYAWLAVFRKDPKNGWKLESLASTNEPTQSRRLADNRPVR